MKIDWNMTIPDLMSGEPIKDGDHFLTAKAVAINALTLNDGSAPLETEEKLENYYLSKKISKNEEEYTLEEAVRIKKFVGKWYGPMVVGPVFQLIEGKK